MNTKQVAFFRIVGSGIGIIICIIIFIVGPQNFIAYDRIRPPNQIKTITANLLELRNDLLGIWRYSRGEKIRHRTLNALGKLDKQLQSLGVSTSQRPFNNRPCRRSEDVCPEQRTKLLTIIPSDILSEYFESANCSYSKPLPSLLTVAINFAGGNTDGFDTLKRIISGIQAYNKALTVVVAISEDKMASQISELKTGITIMQVPKADANNSGKIWNRLIEKTKTPYILIGRALEWFTNDIKLERMIREITELDVSFVAGSTRTIKEGRLSVGCHQTDLMNYTLKYEVGYYESMHECVFCDYVTGPFVTRTGILTKLKFDETSFNTEKSKGLFEDLFFRLQETGGESAVCPDSMFFTKAEKNSGKKDDWQAFAKKWKLSRLVLGGQDFKYSCQEIATTCPLIKGVTLAPCCLQDLANVLKFVYRFCEKRNITCETLGGTTLGAMKFHSVLPWERDGDIRFLSVSYPKVKSLESVFTQNGYKIIFHENTKACTTMPGGSVVLWTSLGWGVDFWGVCIPSTDSVKLIEQGFAPTKINIDGEWINSNGNPGSYSRDRYKKEVYTHVEHYWTFGGNPQSTYVPGYFAQCPSSASGRVARSGCLDQYFPDGVLQFG